MSKTLRTWLLTAILLFSSLGFVAAGGRQEDPIRQARELVAANRINEAILLLEQTVRDDPERIQEAESLMRTIREIRGEYNVLFEQLIDNLINNPDDIDRTLSIIDQMEALDEFPNERVVEQVQDARIVAQLAFDRNLLDNRMDEARLLLEEGEYIAAVEIYLELRSLQRERFEARGYGDIFLNSVDAVVEELSAVSGDFTEALPTYQRAGNAILARASQDVLLLQEGDLAPFFGEAERMASVVARADQAAQDIAVIRSQVPLQFPDDPVDWYLNFQESLARGRGEYRDEEGLLFAVRESYRETVGQLADAGRSQTLELMELADTAADRDQFDLAGERYGTAGQTAALWEQAVAVQAGIFTDSPELPAVIAEVDTESAAEVVEARINREASASLAAYTTTMEEFLSSSEDRADTLFSLQSRIAATESTVNALRTGQGEYAERAGAIDDLPDGTVPERARERITAVSRLWNTGIDRTIAEERALAVRISATRTDGVDARLESLDNRLAETEPLVAGVEEEDAEGIVRAVRYPDDALAEYLAIQELIREEDETVQLAADELAAENDYVLSGPAVRDEQDRLEALDQRAAALLETATDGAAVSRNLIAQSEALVDEANQRIADTRAAIAGFQVNAARNNYAAARDAFLEALALREDPALRESSDELISAVGAELQELENVIVVRRVRELITAAEELYGQDEYVAARDTLLTAQETWEQTNVEANTEVDRLLRLVTAALSLEEGRELATTDPLYPVLGNYLSIAREDFNQGVRLYEAGSTERANVLFDRSIENLRNVRDVRPLNWDARILELRISQIRNEDDFDQVFAARYDQAVSRLDEAGPLEVYSELEVLAEINPEYPGIQEQIRRLEIALGLRENPVDQARVNRAAELLSRARTLANGSRDQATVAISLLEEAVDLNPRNNDAKFLLDQLRIRLGGQATVALSSADEEQYRRAETLFVQGRALQALQITEQLLQNGANRNYPPLVELRRRIGLRLGI
jgi:hypothetical protein